MNVFLALYTFLCFQALSGDGKKNFPFGLPKHRHSRGLVTAALLSGNALGHTYGKQLGYGVNNYGGYPTKHGYGGFHGGNGASGYGGGYGPTGYYGNYPTGGGMEYSPTYRPVPMTYQGQYGREKYPVDSGLGNIAGDSLPICRSRLQTLAKLIKNWSEDTIFAPSITAQEVSSQEARPGGQISPLDGIQQEPYVAYGGSNQQIAYPNGSPMETGLETELPEDLDPLDAAAAEYIALVTQNFQDEEDQEEAEVASANRNQVWRPNNDNSYYAPVFSDAAPQKDFLDQDLYYSKKYGKATQCNPGDRWLMECNICRCNYKGMTVCTDKKCSPVKVPALPPIGSRFSGGSQSGKLFMKDAM